MNHKIFPELLVFLISYCILCPLSKITVLTVISVFAVYICVSSKVIEVEILVFFLVLNMRITFTLEIINVFIYKTFL